MEDIRDYGAKVDGVTNDTQAVRKAKNAAGPGGTIYFPRGTTIVDSKDRSGGACLRFVDNDTAGISVVGDGPGKSIVKVEGGHQDNIKGIRYFDDHDHDGAVIRDLTLDGNWSEQTPKDGDWGNGFGIEIRGGKQAVTIENCVVQNWITNGGLMGAAGIRVRNCTFRNNGWGVHQEGRRGHGFNVNTSGSSGRVVAENCLFESNVGQAVDNNGGKMTIRNCVFDDHEFGIKMDADTEDILLENVHIIGSDRTAIPIKCIPTGNESTGTLRLRSVIIENARWPAIDLPQRPGPVSGDNILIKNVDTDDRRDGGFYIRSDRNVDIGTLSIHNVSGSALHFEGAGGRIDELVYSGVAGVGDTAGVDIGTARKGEPISVSVPSKSEVGAVLSSRSSEGDSPTREYGVYSQPQAGTLNWHEPLNDNFQTISDDVKDLARRLDELESRL
jgi:hypothetical protein